MIKDLITLLSAQHLDIHMLASQLLNDPVSRWDRLKALEAKVNAHFALEDTDLYGGQAREHLENHHLMAAHVTEFFTWWNSPESLMTPGYAEAVGVFVAELIARVKYEEQVIFPNFSR